MIYSIEGNNQTIKIPINEIKNISYKTNMKMQNTAQKVESNEAKSLLLSIAAFGGHPLLQYLGNSAFNTLFDGLTNNYDKINFNAYFEITIETITNGQENKYFFNNNL